MDLGDSQIVLHKVTLILSCSLICSVKTNAVAELPKPTSQPREKILYRFGSMCFNLSPNEIELSITCCDNKLPILPRYLRQYSLSNEGDILALSMSSVVYILPNP